MTLCGLAAGGKLPLRAPAMTSIHTNSGAISALQTLRSISGGMEKAQGQISSGLRVSTASDNAAYWSIATTMKSERADLSAVSDAIEFTSAVLATAYAGMDAIQKEFSTVRNLMIAASQMPAPEIAFPGSAVDQLDQLDPGYNRSQQAKIAHEVDQHMLQIRTILQSSSFAGVNLLYVGDNSPVRASEVVNSFVTGYADGRVLTSDLALKDTLLVNDSFMDAATFSNMDPEDDGLFDPPYSLSVVGADGETHATGLASFSQYSVSWEGGRTTPITKSNDMIRTVEMYVQRYGANRQAAWDYLIPQIDERLQGLIDRMSTLGSLQKAVQAHGETVAGKMDAIDRGVGRLIDTDMNEASTRFRALETQQQLANQALTIANSNAENILRLFG
jgi:flagellin